MKSLSPRKQRKYLGNAPLHKRRKFVSAHLSKELREKYKKRNVPVRKGDKVKILRGNDKGHVGKVDVVNLKSALVEIEGLTRSKLDGTKIKKPLKASNLMIIEMNLEDKKRAKVLERRLK